MRVPTSWPSPTSCCRPAAVRRSGPGTAIALPDGYAAFVHPRSGLAARHGVTVVNAPGTVDAGYRGEIRVTLLNTDTEREFVVSRGDRIAQLVVQRVESAVFVEVQRLPGSQRGDGGHGSTGGFADPTRTQGPGRPADPDDSAQRPLAAGGEQS